VPKFRWATSPNSEVIMAHLFHFKPIFDLPLKKVVRGAPSQVGGTSGLKHKSFRKLSFSGGLIIQRSVVRCDKWINDNDSNIAILDSTTIPK